MTKSPGRFFFVLAIIAFGLGALIDYSYQSYFRTNALIFPVIQELELARHLYKTGQINQAINEYKSVIDKSSPGHIQDQAYSELNYLVMLQDQGTWRLRTDVAYVLWYLLPKLYIFGGICLLLVFLFVVVKPFVKKPELIILPLHDFSELQIGEVIPKLANDRLRELKWKFDNLSNTALILSETLDVPIMGITSDEDTFQVSDILETALIFSGGPSNIPITRIFNSLRLWFEQPKYIARGSLRLSGENLFLHLILINNKKNAVEKSWHIHLACDENKNIVQLVVDMLIYPLMHHFNLKKTTHQWESYKSLCDGIETLSSYKEEGNKISCLDKSKEFILQAIELDPLHELAIYNLGLLLLRLGEYELAREKFQVVANTTSDYNLKQFALYSYSVSLFELSQDWSYKRSSDSLKELIDSSHNKDVVLMARATLVLIYARLAERDKESQKKYIELANREIATVKSSRTKTAHVVAVIFAGEGYININLSNLHEAIRSFHQSVEANPENVSSWIGLGDAYIKNGQSENALNSFKKAASLSPSSGYPNYRLGNIYRELGNVEGAIEAYKSAPQFALAHLSLGKIYLALQRHDEALDEFRKTVEINKRISDAWINIAWTICEMGQDAEYLAKEAEASARRALQLEQNKSQLWHRHIVLARTLFSAKKFDNAYIEAKQAFTLEPEQPQVLYFLALIEHQIGYIQDAKKNCQRILNSSKDDWKINAKLLLKSIDSAL